MFRYIKAFRIIMKGKDLKERYELRFAVSSILGLILYAIGVAINNDIIITIGLISMSYVLYCAAYMLLSDNIKNFFKQLKETANKLK